MRAPAAQLHQHTNTPMHLQNDTDNERREVSYMESKHIHGTCE